MFVMRTEVRYVYAGGYGVDGAPSTRWADAAVSCVVALATRLRGAGVRVSTSEELDAVAALAALDVCSRTQVRSALAACLVKDDAHSDAFHRAFNRTFPRLQAQVTPPGRPDGEAGPLAGAAAGDPTGDDAAG